MAKSELPFDKIINEKLEAFSAPDIPDWSFMQDKIIAAENDLLFDEKIKETLKDLKVDSPQIQWESFVAKKNRQVARRNKIISARLIESCLILLLLWTIDNIGISHIINPNIHPNLKSNPITALNSEDLLSKEPANSNTTDGDLSNQNSQGIVEKSDEPNHKGFDSKKFTAAYSLDETVIHKKLHKPNSKNPISKSSITAESVESAGNHNLNSNQNNSILSNESSDSPVKQITREAINTNDAIHIDETKNAKELSNTTEFKTNSSDAIEITNPLKSEIHPIINDEVSPNVEFPVLSPILILKPLIPNKSVVLNIHSGLMMNVVISPALNETDPIKQYTQLRPGFQTAISLGFQSKNIILESGLIYQNFVYEPNQKEKIDIRQLDVDTNIPITTGYYYVRFTKIKTQILSLPVLIHFNLFQGSNWAVSSKAGLSLSFALKNQFSLESSAPYYYPSGYRGFSIENPNDKSEIAARVNNSSNKGLLDGGDFGINSFSNLVAGIRYQRRLNSNLNFYTELEVCKMLGNIGFGPNGDRFISSNLNTGISIKL